MFIIAYPNPGHNFIQLRAPTGRNKRQLPSCGSPQIKKQKDEIIPISQNPSLIRVGGRIKQFDAFRKQEEARQLFYTKKKKKNPRKIDLLIKVLFIILMLIKTSHVVFIMSLRHRRTAFGIGSMTDRIIWHRSSLVIRAFSFRFFKSLTLMFSCYDFPIHLPLSLQARDYLNG